jgi:hypothetical protein
MLRRQQHKTPTPAGISYAIRRYRFAAGRAYQVPIRSLRSRSVISAAAALKKLVVLVTKV